MAEEEPPEEQCPGGEVIQRGNLKASLLGTENRAGGRERLGSGKWVNRYTHNPTLIFPHTLIMVSGMTPFATSREFKRARLDS